MKWYVGVVRPYSIPRIAIIFKHSGKVTEKKFGHTFGYVFGGYNTKAKAIQVANYQGFIPVLLIKKGK